MRDKQENQETQNGAGAVGRSTAHTIESEDVCKDKHSSQSDEVLEEAAESIDGGFVRLMAMTVAEREPRPGLLYVQQLSRIRLKQNTF